MYELQYNHVVIDKYVSNHDNCIIIKQRLKVSFAPAFSRALAPHLLNVMPGAVVVEEVPEVVPEVVLVIAYVL